MPQSSEQASGRTMRLTGAGKLNPSGAVAPSWVQQRPRPSARRTDEDRERRARERTIAAWLRSLSR